MISEGEPRLMAAKRDDDTLSQCETSASTISPRSTGTISPKEWQDGQTSPLSEDPVVIATDATMFAVRALCTAIAQERVDREDLRQLCAEALALAEAAHSSARETRPRRRRRLSSSSRQSFCEFATLLGDGGAGAAEEGMKKVEATLKVAEECRSGGARCAEGTLGKARSKIEQHFMIDRAFRMLGPLVHDSSLARDVHDWYNLVALVPVIVLNFLNFSCPSLDSHLCGLPSGVVTLPGLWTGRHWESFWWTTFFYFVADLLFVILLPRCVRSPKIIIGHHIATLLYIMVPKTQPKFAWLMGCCMTVEVNTWFLIARRTFNKLGEKPFRTGVSLRRSLWLAAISGSFYASWFTIRILFYPYLFVAIVREWYHYWGETGTPFNFLLITPIIQGVLICMNFKWTADMIRSKLKGRGKAKGL